MRLRRLGLSVTLGLLIVAGVLVALSSCAGEAEPTSTEPIPAEPTATEATAVEATTPVPPTAEPTEAAAETAAVEAPGDAGGTASSAHLVVVFSGDRAAVREITWTGTISRVAALRAAGFTVVEDPDSADTVCSIDDDGCPEDECFTCGSNNWWQGQWDGNAEAWDSSAWPPPLLADGDVIGFRNGTAWAEPSLPAPSYLAGSKALRWLLGRQDAATGAYGNVGGTLETLFAVAANGWDPTQWRRAADSPSLLHYLYGYAGGYAVKAGEAGKTAVALAAAGACWPVNAQKPQDFYDADTGQYAAQATNQAWAMLGVRALGDGIPSGAAQALKAMISDNGGWGWPGFGEDTDTTALAIQALIAAGESPTSTHVVSGLNYLKARQNPDGGFNAGWADITSNASTGNAIMAIVAAGQNPVTGTWLISGNSPLGYLVDAQQGDGSYAYDGDPNELETRQAAVGLLGGRFPLATNDAMPECYGLAGRVVWGDAAQDVSAPLAAAEPVTGVTIVADGWNGAAVRTANAEDGAYLVSVPEAGAYTVTPTKEGYSFAPAASTVIVEGEPGTVVVLDDFVLGAGAADTASCLEREIAGTCAIVWQGTVAQDRSPRACLNASIGAVLAPRACWGIDAAG